MPRLLVIDPSVLYPEVECARLVMAAWGGESRLLLPAMKPDDRLHEGAGHDYAAAVLLGSCASVHEDLAWARDLSAWLTPILSGEARLPLLGICYGHQLIAHLAGGQVEFLYPDRRKRDGVEVSTFEKCALVPEGGPRQVVVSHAEVVTSPPPGYRVVAARPGVVCDGLEHEELPIFSVQFHPEARGDFLARRGHVAASATPELAAGMDLLLAAFLRQARGGAESPDSAFRPGEPLTTT